YSFKNVNNALNENKTAHVDFNTQIKDLIDYFNDNSEHQRFTGFYATPFIQTQPTKYLLGTSQQSVKLATKQVLRLVTTLMRQNKDKINTSIRYYRQLFKTLYPSQSPYVIISTFFITADNMQKVKDVERAFHLWLRRIIYLN